MLECLSVTGFFILLVTVRSVPLWKTLTLTIIKLTKERVPGTNVLAYYVASDVNVSELFCLLLTLILNKLECLNLTILYSFQ